MGVELDLYRSRVGMFVPCHGSGSSIPFYINFSVLIRMIGSVGFVKMLLILAGIEQNPRPADKFVFRYQYLLVQIGTDVLRQLLNSITGNDVVKFLTAHNNAIQSLIAKNVINADQQNILQPVNGSPCMSDFDISLLSCLLRNICGLKSSNDPVWRNPATTDFSIEADITRLRMCRNNLMHSDKLRLPEADLDANWKELYAILTRLNANAGIANLPSLINDAQQMDLDEEMRKSFDETIKAWEEQDRLLDQRLSNVERELTGVKRKLDDMSQNTQQPKCQHLDEITGITLVEVNYIQKVLINFYKRHFKTLPVLPVLEKKDSDLILLYVSPTMNCIGENKKDAGEIKCFEEIFYKEDKAHNEIYITGDAGVGKTSFCRHLCFLWCNVKCGQKIDKEYDYVSKFDCVFYINLRDTEQYNVVDMIKECYFEHYDPKTIINILCKTNCLIVLDGLDEWKPKKDGKKTHELPKREHYDNCIYLTTSRPYRIELVRLSSKDVDRQVCISGIHGKSLDSYIEKILNYMNKQNSSEEKKSSDFKSDIEKCGLTNEIGVPIIASHLVVLWYEKTLDGMTRTLIYANILEMLFQRAKQRRVIFPPSTAPTLQLPDSLSELIYLNEYVSLLYTVCHLSFCSIFKQDDNAANLVFSRHQLQSKPYCFTSEEIDVLCKIGLMSTNEVFECFSVEKLKVTFIHKSYLDFFAALFISSFDSSNSFRDATKTWKCLSDVVQYENLFLLLAGFSLNSIKTLFENIYLALSDDLTSCRKNAFVHYHKYFYLNQLKSLQNIVVDCFKEVSRSNDKAVELEMEDFVFDDHSRNVDSLRKLLLQKTKNAKSLQCLLPGYFDEFDLLKNLQCIKFVYSSSADYVKFTQCMLQNESSLHTVCITRYYKDEPLIPELPVRSLPHLTSLSLSHVRMEHWNLHCLVTFLSENVLIENIKLSNVYCDDHQEYDIDDYYMCSSCEDSDCPDNDIGGGYFFDSSCELNLDLQNHTKLTSLYLCDVNIMCHNVNNRTVNNVNKLCLQSITLQSLYKWIVKLCYSDIFDWIKDSRLQHLHINDDEYRLNYKTMKELTSTVKTLKGLKSLKLGYMEFPGDVLLQLHPHVTQVQIMLNHVIMSHRCFRRFVQRCVSNESEIIVYLFSLMFTSEVDPLWHKFGKKFAVKRSVKYMSRYLESISRIKIMHKDDKKLLFKTTTCL